MTSRHDLPTPAWTAGEIAARLGLSTAVYQKERLGARHIAAIRNAGITRIELSVISGCLDYRDRAQAGEIRAACRAEGVSVVSVHGPFRLPYSATDEPTRRAVVEESFAAIRFAAGMGASVYVAHFGHGDAARKTVPELLDRTGDLYIRLTTENQGGQPLAPFVDVVDEIGSARFGLILDIGHPRDPDGRNPFVKKERARSTLARCGARLFHVHLHETFDLDTKPDHRPPLHPDGIIEWGEVFAALRDVGYAGDLIFEDGRGEDPDEWVRMTADFPRKFVRRYGARQDIT